MSFTFSKFLYNNNNLSQPKSFSKYILNASNLYAAESFLSTFKFNPSNKNVEFNGVSSIKSSFCFF